MRSEHTGRLAWWGLWPLPRLVAVLVAAGLCAWEGTLPRTAAGARWSVGATIAAVLIIAALGGRNRQRQASSAWVRHGAEALSAALSGRPVGRATRTTALGAAVWVALIASTIGWDLYSFALQLHALPTLSRLFGDVTRHEWGRGVVFAGWLLLGGYLALGWRRPLWDAQVPVRRGSGRAAGRRSDAGEGSR